MTYKYEIQGKKYEFGIHNNLGFSLLCGPHENPHEHAERLEEYYLTNKTLSEILENDKKMD